MIGRVIANGPHHGGVSVSKKYDPLWELVGAQLPLQGVEQDVDALCPNCHVNVHIGLDATVDQNAECGLCGASLRVVRGETGLTLRLMP